MQRFHSTTLWAATFLLLGAALSAHGDGQSSPPPTFVTHVAPILYRNCASCHRSGEVAPFPLLTYEDARKRARQIALITSQRVMPPWKPQPGYGGHFHGEHILTDTQIAVLKRWADAGAPEGDPRKLPPPPKFAQGWQLGKPDMVITMLRPVTIPAEGADVYRSYVIPIHLPADRYIRAFEFRPGSRRVVHHAVVTVDKFGGKASQFEAHHGGPGAGFPGGAGFGTESFIPIAGMGGYVPGMMPQVNPAGLASTLARDSDVVFSMHYHPTGKVETDQSRVGVYFTDQPPTRIASTILMGVLNLAIDPGEADHLEDATYTLPCDVEMRGISPHMHLLGKTCKIWAVKPDGTTRPLIKVNDWDFNWQGTYRWAEPFRLPRGTVLHGEWTHDNTASNPHQFNDPPRRITNGENSTNEMAGVWMDVVVDRPSDVGALWGANIAHLWAASQRPPAHHRERHRDTIGAFLIEHGGGGPRGLLVTALSDPIGGLAKGALALGILPTLAACLLPRATRGAAERLAARPWRSLGGGLLVLVLVLLPALAMIFSWNPGVQMAGLFLVGFLLSLTAVGAGGWNRWLARRVGKQSGRSETLAAVAIAGLVYALACLFPVLGWFVITPLSLALGVGAAAGTITLPRIAHSLAGRNGKK